jgi:hypothetical protein
MPSSAYQVFDDGRMHCFASEAVAINEAFALRDSVRLASVTKLTWTAL